jgi:hypothetical protein
MNANSQYHIDILNGILNRMEVDQIVFYGIPFANKNIIVIEFVEDIYGRGHKYTKKYYWVDINSMFNSTVFNISDAVKSIKIESSIYDALNCNALKFLEIISKCHSLEEFMMKIQLMGI